MAGDLIGKIRRAIRKDPRYVARRLWLEARTGAERWLAPRRLAATRMNDLASHAGCPNIDALWVRLASRPPAHPRLADAGALEALKPGANAELTRRAGCALRQEVDLLGSGPVTLPDAIDWHADLKTGHRWTPAYHRDIDYNNFDRSSDVKLAWELSRLQWALPLGQAWLLHRDDACAAKLRALLEHWIDANPYGFGVNWACTMEPALRILTWTWFFNACHDAPSWQDATFRERFLTAVYQHADFVEHNLERADINGNHYTANAAGLVYAGLFFGDFGRAGRWADLGWSILVDELPRQVFADGVDFEASVPYHRLNVELFSYPALYRHRSGLSVPDTYRERLIQAAQFIAAYSRCDGSVPLWGDADDGRALAFGMQSLNDHRYLLGVLGLAFADAGLCSNFSGPRDEIAWLLGLADAQALPDRPEAPEAPSQAFNDGGFYVLRDRLNHVFIDCGPIGLAGRGGHGHNDLLSFEAMLDGVMLVSDCGAYLYSASPAERNRFRSTEYHNTPQVDNEEINRFIRPDYLWTLHNDARHAVLSFHADPEQSHFEGCHDGYARLASPIVVARRFELDHRAGRLTVADRFKGGGIHRFSTRWHLAHGIEARGGVGGSIELHGTGGSFVLRWLETGDWTCRIEGARVSPSYGRVVPTQALVFERSGTARPLTVTVERAAQCRRPS